MAEDMHCLHATERQAGESCIRFRDHARAEPDSHCWSCNCRSALEAAQHEAEARELLAYERAIALVCERTVAIAGPGTGVSRAADVVRKELGITPEAITKATAWCRAEMAK